MSESYFNIKADYKEANYICQNISKKLSDMNIDTADIAACEIATREALNNIIKHAYLNNCENNIEIFVSANNNKVSISVSDYGKERTEIKAAILNFNPHDIENLPESGFGLYIIEKVMDLTEYISENGKNTYTITKILKNNNKP